MAKWQGIRWYLKLCGIRGTLKIGLFRFFKWPTELTVLPFGRCHPVCLRIDTSDFCSYQDVLISRTKSYLPTGDRFDPRTIIDVGAHVGMSSILFARAYPDAKIIALEPEQANYHLLRRNTASYRNINCVQAALWNEDGEVNLRPSNAHIKGTFEIGEEGVEKVRAITMNTLMSEMGISHIDLLKIDIEGAEKEVFRSCSWIRNVQILAIELHDRVRPGCSDSVNQATIEHRSERAGDITFFRKE